MKNKIINIILALAAVCLAGCSANATGNDTSSDTRTITSPADQASSEIDTGADKPDMELSMNHPDETTEEKSIYTDADGDTAIIPDSPTTIYFGCYPQQTAEDEPIEWLVLDEQDGQMLLLSKDCLASLPWHNAHTAVTWDISDLRAWLNGEFLENAFSEEEQSMIVLCDLDNSDVLQYGTSAGADTQDRVFLLSGDEGQKYLTNDELRTAVPTRQALSQGAYTNGAGQCAWWLRSPGMTETSPAYYASAGSIGSRAHEVNETIIGVRPAMWVKMELEENADSSTAKELFDWAHSLDEEQMDALEKESLTATGVVTYIGLDIHGLPSIRLSDSVDGLCYVHPCLRSETEYNGIQVGDTVTVTGCFHILSNDWGVVLKDSRVNR